jgi:hypothetical protein
MTRDRIYIVEPNPDARPEGAVYMQFQLETADDHSWPPAEWESLWVRPEPGHRIYRVLSVPAFVTAIAVNDLVLGKPGPQGNIGFDRKIASGGHSTIRIFVNNDADEQLVTNRIASIIDDVTAAGCALQRTGWDLIIAVDIPTLEAYEHVYDDCLIPRGDAGELSVESACMTFDA